MTIPRCSCSVRNTISSISQYASLRSTFNTSRITPAASITTKKRERSGFRYRIVIGICKVRTLNNRFIKHA